MDHYHIQCWYSSILMLPQKSLATSFFFKSTNIRKTVFDIMLISTAYAGLFDENRTDVNMILHGQSHDFSEGPPTAKIRVTNQLFWPIVPKQTAWKQTKKFRRGGSLELLWNLLCTDCFQMLKTGCETFRDDIDRKVARKHTVLFTKPPVSPPATIPPIHWKNVPWAVNWTWRQDRSLETVLYGGRQAGGFVNHTVCLI